MQTIAILDDFKINDVSDEDDVQSIINKIIINGETDVKLDFSGCLIDYPATSKIVDKILDQLWSLPGVKKLHIVTDYILPITTMVNWVFLGSQKLNMAGQKEMSNAEIIQTITTALNPVNILITISIIDKTGVTKDELKIPSKN
jgi:hypothetical protein